MTRNIETMIEDLSYIADLLRLERPVEAEALDNIRDYLIGKREEA